MPDPLSLSELRAFDAGSGHGEELRFCCPLPACADKKKAPGHRSLSVNTRTGAWHCHRCGAGGLLAEFHTHEASRTAPSRAGALAARRRAALQAFLVRTPSPKSSRDVTPPADHEWRGHLDGLQPLAGTPADEYLQRRGIPTAWGELSGAGFHPHWGGRPAVVFGIRDRAGELVAAQGRYIDGRADPKTRTYGPAGQGVFASPSLRVIWRLPAVIVVEAPIDALSLAVCGFPALATMGARTDHMWLVEACVGRQVLIGYDHDRTGEEKGQGLGAAFAAVGIFPKRLRSEIATDWNEHLQRVGRDRMAADVRTAILGQQVAHALVPVGGRVGDLNGQWWGIVTAAHPADDLFPCGWVELATTEGGYVQADMRTLMTTTGTPVVPPGSRWHTPEEIFAIAKEDPEDG